MPPDKSLVADYRILVATRALADSIAAVRTDMQRTTRRRARIDFSL